MNISRKNRLRKQKNSDRIFLFLENSNVIDYKCEFKRIF